LSSHSDDLGPERLVEDVRAFIESIGEPVGLVGESGGGRLALGAAADNDAVRAVAVYEPAVFEVQDEEVATRFEETVSRARAMAEEGDVADAIIAFAEFLANDDELDALSTSDDGVQALTPNAAVQLEEFEQEIDTAKFSPTDSSLLAEIAAPVLVLHGSRSALKPWFLEGVHYVSEHVSNSRVREIDEAGHFGIALAPEPIGNELTSFFDGVLSGD
jgi:pimeloyl-ACP methyl ester carboxylesterase